MQKFMKRALCVLICALLLASLALSALAGSIELLNTEKKCSLTVVYEDDGTAVSGAPFALYRVADVNEKVDVFTLAGQFAKYTNIDVSNTKNSNSEWLIIAKMLADYATADGLTADKTGNTNTDGKLTFSELDAGMYLVVGESYVVGKTRYLATPYLLVLPNRSQSDYTLNYDLTSNVKFTKQTVLPDLPSHKDTTDRKVLKVWNDNDNSDDRPNEITVHLLCDGEVFDTVTLNEKNHWRHEWNKLSIYNKHGYSIRWTVTEEPVEGYTTLISEEGITSVITNTREMPTPAEVVPDSTLPQTGLLWWPVLVLFAAGMVILMVGVVVSRKKKA